MKNYTSVGLTLRHATLDRIEKLASAKRRSRADFIRQLIDLALPLAERGFAPDMGRLLTLQEHQTLVLDALARKHIPDEADRLALAAVDAMKKHHGA
jgi:hypothetical protein